MIVSLVMSIENNLSAFTAQVPCRITENSVTTLLGEESIIV